MSDVNVFPIKAFTDNYIWCLSKDRSCVVVDPGDANPVLSHCDQHGLTLSAILITHHHWDHTGGIADLLDKFPGIPVYGPANPAINHLSIKLKEGDTVQLAELDMTFDILEVPGHTLDHIAYLSGDQLFCGDTLFSGGCGRLFEGTAEQMYTSLTKLTALNDNTRVYCTHEYTLANLAFAVEVDPDNAALREYTKRCQLKRDNDQVTLPSNIGLEKAINPFLRSEEFAVQSAAKKQTGTEMDTPVDVFSAIRRWKDQF